MGKKTLFGLLCAATIIATPVFAVNKVVIILVKETPQIVRLMNRSFDVFFKRVGAGIDSGRYELMAVQGEPYLLSEDGSIEIEPYDDFSILATLKNITVGDYICFRSESAILPDARRPMHDGNQCGRITDIGDGMNLMIFVSPSN